MYISTDNRITKSGIPLILNLLVVLLYVHIFRVIHIWIDGVKIAHSSYAQSNGKLCSFRSDPLDDRNPSKRRSNRVSIQPITMCVCVCWDYNTLVLVGCSVCYVVASQSVRTAYYVQTSYTYYYDCSNFGWGWSYCTA